MKKIGCKSSSLLWDADERGLTRILNQDQTFLELSKAIRLNSAFGPKFRMRPTSKLCGFEIVE